MSRLTLVGCKQCMKIVLFSNILSNSVEKKNTEEKKHDCRKVNHMSPRGGKLHVNDSYVDDIQ